MMQMTPQNWFGYGPPPPQNPYLSLSQAVAPRPQPQVPYYNPPVSPFMPTLPQPAPYQPQTLASPPETDTRSGLRRGWDQGLYQMSQPQEGFDLLNPPIPGPQTIPLPPRPGSLEELTPIEDRTLQPNYWPTTPGISPEGRSPSDGRRPLPYDTSRAEPGVSRQGILDYLKGLNEGDWLGEESPPPEPMLPGGYGGLSPEERDEARPGAGTEAPPAGTGGTNAILAAYGLAPGSVPGLPARTDLGEVESPDFGPFPGAPTYAAPDFAKANQYLEAARPKAPEASQEEIGLAMLMGATRGFSPYGSAGEILGRMAAPGAEAGWAERKEDQALQREYENNLASWNAAMGTQAGSQATTEASVKNENVRAQYENATAKYQDAIQRYQYGDERQRWQATHDLARYGAELERLRIGVAQAGVTARLASRGGGGQMTYAALQDAIHKGAQYGWLPGIDLNAVRAGALQEMLADPNWGQQAQALDPAGFKAELDRRAMDSVSRTVMADKDLANQVLMFASKPKGSETAEDFIDSLTGAY